MKKDTQHIKYGKIIQRSTGTKPFLKRFEASVTMERQHSGRPRRAITPENEEVVEEMICSQDYLRTYVPQKDIVKGLKMSQSSVRRIIKRRRIKQLKRLKTPYMNGATRLRRVDHDFPLQIPINSQNDLVYVKGQKEDVPVQFFLIKLIDNLSK